MSSSRKITKPWRINGSAATHVRYHQVGARCRCDVAALSGASTDPRAAARPLCCPRSLTSPLAGGSCSRHRQEAPCVPSLSRYPPCAVCCADLSVVGKHHTATDARGNRTIGKTNHISVTWTVLAASISAHGRRDLKWSQSALRQSSGALSGTQRTAPRAESELSAVRFQGRILSGNFTCTSISIRSIFAKLLNAKDLRANGVEHACKMQVQRVRLPVTGARRVPVRD